MGDVVAGAAGATIGFFATGGNPAGAKWGWAIGSSLGSMLSSGPDIQGPRLNDLQIIDSSYGQPIPIIYGRDRVSGNIIWKKPLEEVKNEEEQGKGGGPTTTTYNYFATFALGLCEGEIDAVRRIWIDSKLIYKFTEDATLEEVLASNALIDGITVYTGSESQEPDPIIQADKGIANTPAFRGLAYLLFDRLDVGNSGRIPNITVEVVANGSLSTLGSLDTFTIDVGDIGGGTPYITSGLFDGESISIGASSVTSNQWRIGFPDAYRMDSYTLSGAAISSALPESYSVDVFIGADQEETFRQVEDVMSAYFEDRTTASRGNLLLCGVYGGFPVLYRVDGYLFTIDQTINIGTTSATTTRKLAHGRGYVEFNWTGSVVQSGATPIGTDLTQILSDYGAGSEYIMQVAGSLDDDIDFLYVFTSASSMLPASVTKYYKLEFSQGIWSVTEDGSCSFTTSQIEHGGTLENGHMVIESENYVWGTATRSGGGLEVTYLEKSGTTWATHSTQSANFSNATATPAGGTDIPRIIMAKDGVMFTAVEAGDLGSSYRFTVCPYSRNKVVTANGVTLSSIVSDLCQRAGLEASDIDVSALTDTVQGYTVTRPMSARSAIEPLMLAYFFDGGEYSNKLNFVKRGGSVVTTIPEVGLGVDSEDLFSQTRQQEAELPSEVIFNYKDINRDFQPGSQRSRRINTNVENVRQVELPIALTANNAKRKCEINHYNSWVERDKFTIQVTDEYLSLNPTNVIQFTENSRTRKGRIVDISYGPMMKIEMVAESGNYSSDAVAGESESVDQTIGLIGPTNLELLDIPLLRNQDNDTAIYLAASGYYNAWAGCRVYKSSDDVSFSEVDALFNSATQGQATSVLADASHTVWDRTSTVTVRLPASQSLSSSTESNVLKGANPALIGSEIIHFVNATDNGDNTWTLDTLLRGRRGTDWATDTHAISERFVLLDESKMGRIEVVLNTSRYFKGVSIGNYLVNAASESFTNTGVNLKPFSPTFIRGSRDGSNNLTITWINRSRYIGGALQPLPLFEESRIYKVEILDALGGSVLRTLSPNPTTELDTYSAADQVTDGFTAGDPIPVRISQYSATLGTFGYAKEAIV